jgi:hypothetical protein
MPMRTRSSPGSRRGIDESARSRLSERERHGTEYSIAPSSSSKLKSSRSTTCTQGGSAARNGWFFEYTPFCVIGS